MSYRMLDDVVAQAVAEIREEGTRVDSAFGPTLELRGLTLEVPLWDLSTRTYEDDHPELVATRKFFPFFSRVLRLDPDSRRAAAWIGEIVDGEERFCLPYVQFLMRDRSLDAFVFARSLDVERKFPRDAIAFGRAAWELSCMISDSKDIVLGDLRVFAASAHVYVDGGT